jgi:hypothetical protein
MNEKWQAFFLKNATLLVLLVLQVVVFWTLMAYLGNEIVPVAYQRF